jgi:hypothetical protein
LVARELEPVVEDLRAVFGLEVSLRDPGVAEFGLHNAVMPVGDTFLEVVSPVREHTSAGRLLERRGGDGGYMVIFQSDDLERDRRRIDELGIRVVWEIALPDAATLHLHPRDVGAAIVSLDAMNPPTSWRWAGPDWERSMRTGVVQRIAGVEVQGADPATLATRWSEVLLASAEWDGESEYTTRLEEDGARVRFVPDRDGRGAGVAAVLLETTDPERALGAARDRGLPVAGDTVSIGGTGFQLVPPIG